MFHIASAEGPPPIPEHFSHEARDFLRLCFNRNPKERPNASRLLLHPFVATAVNQESMHSANPWPDPLSAVCIDGKVDISDELQTTEIDSKALNLVSEPSTGMTLKPAPLDLCKRDNKPQITTPLDELTAFEAFTREDLRNNEFLKRQWANELEKELKAMKDRGRQALE